jgi:hypothetical protein
MGALHETAVVGGNPEHRMRLSWCRIGFRSERLIPPFYKLDSRPDASFQKEICSHQVLLSTPVRLENLQKTDKPQGSLRIDWL